MPHSTFFKLAGIGTFAALIISCGFLENAASQASSATDAVKSEAGQTGKDPRVQGTLALRSVQMDLETSFPGENPKHILISIDAEGHQRIEMALPVPEGSSDATNSPDANTLEIFVVGGAAYSRIGKEGQAESSPEQIDALHSILYNPTGPGMWLLLLPEKSFVSAGTEEKGGFQATRYTVDGTVEEGTIRGDIWQDGQTKALVGADLSISESLFYPPDSGRNGSVTIRFVVEKADVPAIALPG